MCWFITFQSVLLWLPWDSPWSLASTPWAMSLYFKFRAIYFWLLHEYQWWDEAKIYHIIRQLSHRFLCEIMIWSGHKQNWYTKNISTRIRLRALKPKWNENYHHNSKGADAVIRRRCRRRRRRRRFCCSSLPCPYEELLEQVYLPALFSFKRRIIIDLLGLLRTIVGGQVWVTWWRHEMKTFSALLAICAGNSPVTGEFPRKKASDAELWCFLWSSPESTVE